MEEIEFEALNESHFSLMHVWFNQPHVQAFYSLRPWTLEEVYNKLMPYLQGEKKMKCFIIKYHQHPVGYIQSYPLKDHPWENQDLAEKIVQNAAGIDFFIGEQAYLGKGLGSKILLKFLEKRIWPYNQYCLADPDIKNEASVRLLQKCGFTEHKQISIKNALQHDVTLKLFIKEKSNFHSHR